MKRLIFIATLCLVSINTQAYTISGSLTFPNNNKAVVTITGFSSRFDVLVHQLETAARIKEEGTTVDADSKDRSGPAFSDTI